jgi:3-hydroxyisobutyrate dehydrogenase-like beta-hydroxyacid dehydrogenase
MRIAVIGLGRMGLPIARRLADGHEVRGHDLDPARADAAEASGVRALPALADAVSRSQAVVTALPGPVELRAVVGDGSLFDALAPGAVWVDVTSCDPDTGTELHAVAAARRIASVAAPMIGGPAEARTGALRFLVGGTEQAVGAARPVLDAVAAPDGLQVVDAEPGHAYLLKLLGNLLWFGQVVAVTEALLLGRRHGLDPERTAHLLATGPGASNLFRGDVMATFGLDRVVEELAHLRELADRVGLPFELSRTVARIHDDALDRFGPRSGELLAALSLQEQAGASLRSEGGP